MKLVAALALVALAEPIPPRDLTEAERTAISASVGRQLADPYSAQYEWQPLRDGIAYCGFVNAKNRFGAYAGYRPFFVLYYVGQQSRRFTVARVDMDPAVVSRMCPEAGYFLSR